MVAHLTPTEFPLLAVLLALALCVGIGVGGTLAVLRLANRRRR